MSEKEHVKPVAPASHRVYEEDEEAALARWMEKYNQRKCIKCCGCITAVFFILTVIILVLVFTIFRVKDPRMKMNSVKIEGLDLVLRTNFWPGANLTVVADVSIKNSNVASFKFQNVTTNLYYDKVIGEARTPPGIARARRTLRMNVTTVVMVDQLLDVPRLGNDLQVGALPLSIFTRTGGKVKILNIIRKSVVVRMNCTMTVDIKSQSIQDQKCKRHVSL